MLHEVQVLTFRELYMKYWNARLKRLPNVLIPNRFKLTKLSCLGLTWNTAQENKEFFFLKNSKLTIFYSRYFLWDLVLWPRDRALFANKSEKQWVSDLEEGESILKTDLWSFFVVFFEFFFLEMVDFP